MTKKDFGALRLLERLEEAQETEISTKFGKKTEISTEFGKKFTKATMKMTTEVDVKEEEQDFESSDDEECETRLNR